MDLDVLPGQSYPLGPTVHPDGVNFCVFSRNCTAMELLLFDRADDAAPARVIRLDPARHRTFYYWHAFVADIQPGQLYGYRAAGPWAPEQGLRFDGTKLLLDPYTRAVMYTDQYQRGVALHPGDNCAHAMKSVVVDTRAYDWGSDVPLQRPFAGSIIYELHVGGFTCHPNSGVEAAKRGTYAGLIEKIPYLQALGVTTVELLPVQQFDPQDAPPGRTNYWGYSPIGFFAPHRDYSSRADPLGPVEEFKDMVKALHRAGIEVILDVVFNHTAEGNHAGPTLSFRGLENRAYYMLEFPDHTYYANYSGCGNTLNGNHSIVRRMIVDCLHYWVQGMHVDGFRFDLASVLSRDERGQPLADPPILWEIESDRCWPGPRLSPRPGTPPDSIKWAHSSVIAGPSGTGSIVTTYGVFSKATRARWANSPCASVVAGTSTSSATASRIAASISSPATTVSRSTTWSPTMPNTIRPTARTIVMAATRTGAGTVVRRGPSTIRRSKRCGCGRSKTR
jgi:isoamylase